MKITIITVVYNAEMYIEDCIQSVINQSHQDIEYIVIDGQSTDGTLREIDAYSNQITHFLSEKDCGLYDAINKGIKLATGDVVGLLNADDMLVQDDIISFVARAFADHPAIDAVYGNLNYIHASTREVARRWVSKQADHRDMEKGWMPAHPTLYIRRALFEKYGHYALDLGTAADYDLMLRYFCGYQLKALHLPVLMVNMRMGGVSNRNVSSLWYAIINDYKALKRNKIANAWLVLIRKKLSKLSQF